MGTEMTNIMSLTQRIMNNESPNNGNNTKSLGALMMWWHGSTFTVIHNTHMHGLHYARKKHGDWFVQNKLLLQEECVTRNITILYPQFNKM